MLTIPKKTPKEVQPNLAAMDVETGNDSGEPTKSEDTPVEGDKKENQDEDLKKENVEKADESKSFPEEEKKQSEDEEKKEPIVKNEEDTEGQHQD